LAWLFDDKVEDDADDVEDDDDDEDEAAVEPATLLLNSCGRKAAKLEGSLPPLLIAAIAANKEAVTSPPAEPLSTGLKN